MSDRPTVWYTGATPTCHEEMFRCPAGVPMSDSPQPTDPWEGLSHREKRFAEAYCGQARFNASEAARLAGFSEKTAGQKGYQLKNDSKIRACVDAYLDAHTLTEPELLHELTDVAMRGLHEFVEITRYDKDGDPVAAKMDATAKMKALELIGKARGTFTDKLQVDGEFPVMRILRMGDEG